MVRTAALAGALALLAWSGLHAQNHQPAGKLRICRYPGLTEGADHKSVPIPAGTGYISGRTKDGDDLKPIFTVHTTAEAVLPPKPGCVTVDASLDDNPSNFTLTTKYPTFLPSQLNVSGLEDIARVVADFR